MHSYKMIDGKFTIVFHAYQSGTRIVRQVANEIHAIRLVNILNGGDCNATMVEIIIGEQ